MIYDPVDPSEPIRQGDIFLGLPRIDLSLDTVKLINERGEIEVARWEDLSSRTDPLTSIVSLRPVPAIVASQDCDTVRARDITFCEVRPFRDVERKAAQTESPKSWKNMLTQQARINLKWFYLPPDASLGFTDKMAVDFMVTLRVLRTDVERLRMLRRGRLNSIAGEHFRERIAEFFRRYPYDEWYPLSSVELAAYEQEYPGTKPFPWQGSQATDAPDRSKAEQ